MAFYAVSDLGEILAGELQKMWSVAVGFQRGVVFVLLVDEEAARLGLVPVYLVHRAARFLARLFGKFLKQRGHFGLVPYFRHPGDCQNHHLSLLTLFRFTPV